MARNFYAAVLILFMYVLSDVGMAYPTPVDFRGKLQRWNIEASSPVVTWEVLADALDHDYYGPSIAAAFEMWSSVPSSYLELREADHQERANITVELKGGSVGAFSSGYAVFDELSDDGPVHCQIVIAVDKGIGFFAFRKTVLHEIGHCLGLGHSLIPESIMSYDVERNAYALDTDDVAALSRLYPIDGEEPDLPLGCGIGLHNEGHGHPAIFLLLFLIPLLSVLCLFLYSLTPRFFHQHIEANKVAGRSPPYRGESVELLP